MSFSCRHNVNDHCVLLRKPCEPNCKGCILRGRFVFSEPISGGSAFGESAFNEAGAADRNSGHKTGNDRVKKEDKK